MKLNPEPLTVCYYFDTEINARQFACYRIEMLTDEGSFWSEVIVIGEVPSEIALLGPAPNPFNSRAAVTFLLPVKNQVRLTLHNLQGQMVRTIYKGVKDAGVHAFSLDAAGLPAGAYFVRLETVERTIAKPLTILK